MKELWKSFKDDENYLISNYGRVYSLKSNMYLSQRLNKNGYLSVKLYCNGKKRNEYIHRLVALTFIDNPDKLPQVNHLDENKQNNYVENLQWVTSKENNNYGSHNEKVAKAHRKPVMCVELNRIFDSAKEAERITGIFATQINAVCRGKGKTAGGYHWRRV